MTGTNNTLKDLWKDIKDCASIFVSPVIGVGLFYLSIPFIAHLHPIIISLILFVYIWVFIICNIFVREYKSVKEEADES